jgi:CO/xanthine dehydrogenase FAD-binding subunit
MLLHKFDFHEPASVDEACEIMDTYGAKAKLLAGGTDLMVNMKKKSLCPNMWFAFHGLPLCTVLRKRATRSSSVEIYGRGTDRRCPDRRKSGCLAFWCKSPRFTFSSKSSDDRGNIGSARPAADLPPSLIAYGATVMLESSSGQREVSLGAFSRAPVLPTWR